uniref:hypothetical protein n=1 Tax=Dematophora necatrix TaxID=2751867 RepID=UPI0030E15829
MFFFWYGFSWVTRNGRIRFFSCSFMKNIRLSFNRSSSFRVWRGYFILTFCRYCVAFAIYICVLLRFLIKYVLNNIISKIIVSIPILDITNPSILLANPNNLPGELDDPNNLPGELDDPDSEDLPGELDDPDSDDLPGELDDPDSDDFNDEINEGLSDKSDDSEGTLELKQRIRENKSWLDELKDVRKQINDDHSAAQDVSDSEQEEIELNRLLTLDIAIENHKENLHLEKDELKSKEDNKRKRDLDDEGDNNRRGGPSAGTTGGPSEGAGGSSGGVGGSSGGVEGSSRVKSESPMDFVLEKESLDFPSFLDDIE